MTAAAPRPAYHAAVRVSSPQGRWLLAAVATLMAVLLTVYGLLQPAG